MRIVIGDKLHGLDSVRRELHYFLSVQKWDLFATITFRQQCPSLSAIKAFKRFFKYLNTRDRRFFDKYIECWIFLERHDLRAGVHIHALIRGINPTLAEELEKKCRRIFGQSRILPYDPMRQAVVYLAGKYKSQRLEDFTFFKINSRLRW